MASRRDVHKKATVPMTCCEASRSLDLEVCPLCKRKLELRYAPEGSICKRCFRFVMTKKGCAYCAMEEERKDEGENHS